jgi:cellulose synthase/poly-beta-1,6-N-acetylglucosamine synthase-like glycosyltransferase/peptidoglycan/xylan/chitin deacetylase (PgdA/CDA1 family)/spore germination protein YaaH
LNGSVFHDPSGRRARRTGFAYGLIATVVVLLLAGFAATLAFTPQLPNLQFGPAQKLAGLHPEYRRHGREPGWLKAMLRTRRAAPPVPRQGGARPLVVGFWGGGDDEARASLQEHVGQMDVFAPQWINLTSAQGDITVTGDSFATTVLQNAKKRPAVIALVTNLNTAGWDPTTIDQVLNNPAARARLIQGVAKAADKAGWSGIGFDFEELSPKAITQYASFLAQARAALAPAGRQVWATVPFDNEAWDAVNTAKIAAAADKVVLMAYDEHYALGPAGPPAGQGWYVDQFETLTKYLNPAKTIIALGAYDYKWVRGASEAEAQSFNAAMAEAHDAGAQIVFDPTALNAHFSYRDDDGTDYDEWFLDAVSVFNERQATDYWNPAGYALWRIGSEDPGVWGVLSAPYNEATTENLHILAPSDIPDFDGKGEVLKVVATPHPGQRDFKVDPKTDVVADESFPIIPNAYIVRRRGWKPGAVALTFDDGPDPRWTAPILDILKKYNAPATFFVIGQNMERRPDLVMREVAEGHDVGSHTYTHPNISQVPLAEAQLELTATQRLFQTITGRSLRLFRPPYLGDADPSTRREVLPLLLAQKNGYVTVGLRIDPDDWKKPEADLIVQRVLDRLANPGDYPGQVVLLHDSGGDRRQTIAALPKLIEALRAHGYKLVNVGELTGMTPSEVMPPADRDTFGLALDRTVFFLSRHIEAYVQIMLITAIVLGIARLLFLSSMSLVHRFHTTKQTPPELDPATGPLVSVLIPCFNEEKVIVQSVRRILDSTWTHLEILVLDDGSKDRTSAVVAEAYGDEPRVRLMTFENGGKAGALNRGLKLANGEIVVALDADTLFPPETLGLLARWFVDPKIGAVAGNALVGNRTNIVTRWQALEYVTAQNLERRALAALGAVTVVPGAVGAWRRAALDALGGYPADTLAEDQDLTIAVQQAGWQVTFDSEARAFTESPDTIGGLLKQRFRWSFGTLQCLWKHRAGLFSRTHWALGWVALPQVWLFQIVLTVIAPLVDLAVIWSLISAYMAAQSHPVEYDPDSLIRGIAYWSAFVLLDLAAGMFGMSMERRAPWADLPWLPLQRFGYRQMMYYVVIRAVSTAVKGQRVGWGKLERKATASVQAAGKAKPKTV